MSHFIERVGSQDKTSCLFWVLGWLSCIKHSSSWPNTWWQQLNKVSPCSVITSVLFFGRTKSYLKLLLNYKSVYWPHFASQIISLQLKSRCHTSLQNRKILVNSAIFFQSFQKLIIMLSFLSIFIFRFLFKIKIIFIKTYFRWWKTYWISISIFTHIKPQSFSPKE